MRYPIHNKLSYFLLASIDLLLKSIFFLPGRKKKKIVKVHKLLLCQGAHLGDVILTTALLPVLKKAYPEIKIGFAVGTWALPIVKDHPLIDWVHLIDHWKLNRTASSRISKLRRYLTTRRKALKEIRSIAYDVAIDCPFHFPNMGPLLWQTKIPVRIGFESAGFGPFFTHTRTWDREENRSAVLAFYSLLEYLPNTQELSQHLHPTLSQRPQAIKQPFLIIHLGAGDPKKMWPLENWKALISKLLKKGFPLYFTGRGSQEKRAIESISKDFSSICNLCDQLNWDQFVSLISNASLVIAVDTSAGHIAAAVETPAIVLRSSIHPEELWRPFSTTVKSIFTSLPCSPCFKGCQKMSCIQEISVERVLSIIEQEISV